jgi:hypothetical protein
MPGHSGWISLLHPLLSILFFSLSPQLVVLEGIWSCYHQVLGARAADHSSKWEAHRCITPQQASAQSAPTKSSSPHGWHPFPEPATWTKVAGGHGAWQCTALAVAGHNGKVGSRGAQWGGGAPWQQGMACGGQCTYSLSNGMHNSCTPQEPALHGWVPQLPWKKKLKASPSWTLPWAPGQRRSFLQLPWVHSLLPLPPLNRSLPASVSPGHLRKHSPWGPKAKVTLLIQSD